MIHRLTGDGPKRLLIAPEWSGNKEGGSRHAAPRQAYPPASHREVQESDGSQYPLLAELAAFKPVTVELGLQTIHERSARFIRRGYPLSVYDDAVHRLAESGVDIVTHLILGLPGETRADKRRYL